MPTCIKPFKPDISARLDFRGARVKAFADAGSVTLPWDSALMSVEGNNVAAAYRARQQIQMDWQFGAAEWKIMAIASSWLATDAFVS